MSQMLRALLPAVFVGFTSMFIRAGTMPVRAQEPTTLPDGAGRAIITSACIDCHSLAQVARHRDTRRGWTRIVAQMIDNGAQLTGEDARMVVAYASAALGKRIKINDATAAEIADMFDISADAAAAIVKYRTEHGRFATWKDVANVPGIDAQRIEEQKGNLDFGAGT